MRIKLEGQQPLNGTYEPASNPNAAMALLAAALLTDKPVTLRRVPNTSVLQTLVDLVKWLGAEITTPENGTLTIQASQLTQRTLTEQQIGSSVGVLLLAAPLLVRRQHI